MRHLIILLLLVGCSCHCPDVMMQEISVDGGPVFRSRVYAAVDPLRRTVLWYDEDGFPHETPYKSHVILGQGLVVSDDLEGRDG